MNFHKFIPLIHTFLVAPLLLFVGLNKGKVGNNVFTLLMILGLVAIMYHLTQLLDHGFSNLGAKQFTNIFHILVVGYLFACVGFRKGKVPNFAYTLMLLVVPFVLLKHAPYALNVLKH